MITQQSTDVLAKLLATENITVVRGDVTTASFDLLNRVLRLPRWKEMTPVVEEMLMLHEVGHALFTDHKSVYKEVFESKKHLRDYANVIEDVRIEKKMKDRYPGSRKSFNFGYRELNERDFFGVKGKDLSQSLLIDKINLYFKVGFNCGVQFTPAEQEIVRRVDQCKTEEDVIRLAEEIYGFSQEQLERQKLGLPEPEPEEYEYFDDDEEGEHSEEEQEMDTAEDNHRSTPRSAKGKPNVVEPKDDLTEELKAKTLEKFDKKLEQFADDSLRMHYLEPKFEYESDHVIVPYREVLSAIKREPEEMNRRKMSEFKASSSPMVNYLIKEFEMKKSASMYKRAKIAKIGQLDSKKLYAYKLKEDLFKSVMQVQEGKKHGMIFLLDWSGSMSNCIEETVEQVINLAMFCQRIQIPYQVFAFTDGHDSKYDNNGKIPKQNPNGMGNACHFNLLEFFSHKMTTVEFNKMTEYLMNRPWNKNSYGLNGTPLNEALMYMVDYVGNFIKIHEVEKMSFITLTDGDGGSLYASGGYRNGTSWDYVNDKPRRVNRQVVMRDPITKREYDIGGSANEQTASLLNLMRDRYGINSVGFYLMNATHRSATGFVKHNAPGLTATQMSVLADKIVQGVRRDKFYAMSNIPGRDEFYVLPADVKIRDYELEINPDKMNAGQIARELSKVMNTRKTSRVVLSKFIQIVS